MSDNGSSDMELMEPVDDLSRRRLGPHTVPRIECNRCGTEHHPDAANGEYIGHCRDCSAFLPRPTEAQQRKFRDFIVWKSRRMDADTEQEENDE
jgi:hypothetical protein